MFVQNCCPSPAYSHVLDSYPESDYKQACCPSPAYSHVLDFDRQKLGRQYCCPSPAYSHVLDSTRAGLARSDRCPSPAYSHVLDLESRNALCLKGFSPPRAEKIPSKQMQLSNFPFIFDSVRSIKSLHIRKLLVGNRQNIHFSTRR